MQLELDEQPSMPRDRCPGARSCGRGRRGAQKHLSNLLHVVQVEGYAGVGGVHRQCDGAAIQRQGPAGPRRIQPSLVPGAI
eukprot:COSAG01_NODE_256_length_20138_cov_24.233694_12_plen_81_part_00